VNSPNQDTTQTAENYVFDGGWYENAELRALPKLLAKVRTFVDVGASFGPYTKCASETMRGGRIVAVEANRKTHERLSENCKKWEAESGCSISAVHAAVSDTAGVIDFFVPADNSLPLTSSLIQSKEVATKWDTEKVTCVSLDDLLAKESPDLVKIDIEGAEYRALLGAKQLISAGSCKFLIEIHPWGDPELSKTPEDIFKLMYDCGYDFKVVSRHWYFYQRNKTVFTFLKHQAIRFVMRHSRLKEQLKKLPV